MEECPTELLDVFCHVCHWLSLVDVMNCRSVCHSLYNKTLQISFSQWKELDLSDFQLCMTDEIVERLISREGFVVERLSFARCEEITDYTLRVVSNYAIKLQDLNLSWCSKITDEGISSLCNRSRVHTPIRHAASQETLRSSIHSNLTRMHLSWCTQITDEGIITLVRRCGKYLNQLVCRGCAITDRSCFVIGQLCSNLALLDLSHCGHNITDSGINSILTGCQGLLCLFMEGCHGVSNEMKERVKSTRLAHLFQ